MVNTMPVRTQTSLARALPGLGLKGLGLKRLGILATLAVSLAGCADSFNNEFKAGLTATKTSDAQVKSVAATPAATPDVTGKAPAPAAPARAANADVQKIDQLKSAVTPGSTAYRIGTLDVLEINVFKVPELTKTVQVSDTGSVTYPLLGDVPAAGKTAQELERELTAKLGTNYLQKPQVSVLVKEYNSQRVLVDGAVTKPGVYPIQGKATLLQFVALSGGLTSAADTTVVVFRTVDGKRTAAKFDLDDVRSGAANDPSIQAGDVIVASNSAFKEGFEKVLKIIPLAGVFAIL